MSRKSTPIEGGFSKNQSDKSFIKFPIHRHKKESGPSKEYAPDQIHPEKRPGGKSEQTRCIKGAEKTNRPAGKSTGQVHQHRQAIEIKIAVHLSTKPAQNEG